LTRSDLLADDTTARWFTARSVIIGSIGVAGLCGLVPFNDYVVENTFMIGCFLPPALMLFMLVLVAVVNGALYRRAPKRALSRGELTVILAMMLAACAIPSQGLLRTLIPSMVWQFRLGQTDARWWHTFTSLKLPGWMFAAGDPVHGPRNPIVDHFYDRIPPGSGAGVPFAAWVRPLLGWGIFFVASFATLISLAVLVLPQWAKNERLLFPIAQVELALIESPAPGKALNQIIGSRLFWAGLLTVVFLHSLTALAAYFPATVPVIPIKWNLTNEMGNQPWVWLSGYIKNNRIFFIFLGMAFFIQAKMGFSLWFAFLFQQALLLIARTYQSPVMDRGAEEQHLGAGSVYILSAIWIGRHYFAAVAKSIFKPDPKLRLQRTAMIVIIVGIAIMLTWLSVMGVHLLLAMAIVYVLLLGHAITTRIAAETGLPYYRSMVTTAQIYRALPIHWFFPRDIYFAGLVDGNGPYQARESVFCFSLHALWVADASNPSAQRQRRLLTAMAWALLLGCFVGIISSLECYYHYSQPISPQTAHTMINSWALDAQNNQPANNVVKPMDMVSKGSWDSRGTFNPWQHMLAGAAITVLLQTLSMRYAAWPLLPVGYVASQTYYVQQASISIFLGWLAKVLVLRFGGTRMYMAARPLFIGLILGECTAVGIWLVINLLLAMGGYDYRITSFLPT